MKGKILRVKYGYNPNSSSVGSATSGIMAQSLQNAINGTKTNTSVLAELLGKTVNGSANATTTTTLQRAAEDPYLSWLMQGSMLNTLAYLVSAAITSVVIYFTAKKVARAIRKKMKK